MGLTSGCKVMRKDSCSLTLYHTIPTFNDPKKKTLENTVGKGENAGNQHFLLFPLFSTLSEREIIILATFNLLSVNAFNLVTSKNCLFGKGFKLTMSCKWFCYDPFQNSLIIYL